MVNEYGVSMHRNPVAPTGVPKKQNIRRFTPELFNASNDHNPLVAHPCGKCEGKGFYRIHGPNKRDVPCEQCGTTGVMGDSAPFFSNNAPALDVEPNEVGFVNCPSCGKTFPIYSNQYWTGCRHTCGQKLTLIGRTAKMCWTKKKE